VTENKNAELKVGRMNK